MEVVCLVCKETDSLYSGMAVQFYILTCRVWGIQFFTSLPEFDDATMCFFFLNFSHSNRHAVISSLCLICMSLMVNNAEHLFMCLFAICVYSSMKCLLLSLAYFIIGLFFFFIFLCWIWEFLMYSRSLWFDLCLWCENSFSFSVASVFILLTVFHKANCFLLIK